MNANEIAIIAGFRDGRRQEARTVRRLAERIARQARKLESEIASNATERARLSEMAANAHLITARLQSLKNREDAALAQPSLI